MNWEEELTEKISNNLSLESVNHYKFVRLILKLLEVHGHEIDEVIFIGEVTSHYKELSDYTVYVNLIFLDKTYELSFPCLELLDYKSNIIELTKVNSISLLNFMSISFEKKTNDGSGLFEEIFVESINYYIDKY
jgi:hypothetical protein